MNSVRFWAVTILMCGTAILLQVRGDRDRVPVSRPLNELPLQVGGRTATEVPLDQEVLQVLGKGVFLDRLYNSARGSTAPGAAAPISLFIGYFPTQRTGQSIHSPQNCLPGAGWTFQSSGLTDLTDSSGRRYTVGEYVVSDGRSSQEVLYWYRVHGRSVANDYKAKLYTLADSIRYSRTDAALVRVITPILPGEDRAQAHDRAVGFAEQVVPLLPAYIPE
ncbi:MAG: EpsI family protein [Acidobacteriota bacterium]|nr:EpsI family protein [Acidobacteriota bacterium]